MDRPGGPYPRSLHGHYTDLKGKTWNPCKCDHQSWPWLGRPHTIKYNCKEPFQNALAVFEKVGRKDLKPIPSFFWRNGREKRGVCMLVRSIFCKKVRQDEIKTHFTSFRAGFYMHTLSREALLADKVGWGSGAEPSHLDDWWLSLNA